jgi:transcriptional regulator with XRE-family HTH domain
LAEKEDNAVLRTLKGDFTWREVGDRVRAWRLAAGMSQAVLAIKTGLTQPGIAAVESGSHDPRLSTLQAIARALGRSTRELICGYRGKRTPAMGKLIPMRRIITVDHRRTIAAAGRAWKARG